MPDKAVKVPEKDKKQHFIIATRKAMQQTLPGQQTHKPSSVNKNAKCSEI
jgi:hypothetical protein